MRIMGAATTGDAKVGINGKRMLRPSSSTRHTTKWPISDASSDLTVEIGTTSLSFHKLPLISRSGRIRKLLSESKDSKISKINLPSNTPGGAPAFELVAKFSYGINIELTLSNIATLRCLAHVLEMTEDISEKNLEAICESFIYDTVLPSISNCISILHQCQSLIPISNDINLVSTLIQAIANNVTKEQYPSLQQNYIDTKQGAETAYMPYNNPLEPLLSGLDVLNLDFFYRLVTALTTNHHLSPHLLISILVHYANTSLNYPNQSQTSTAHTVETLTSLLPSNPPIPFLSGLLKHAIASSASIPCISDLERRIGSRLDDAILEDVLIPAKARNGDDGNTVFDVDAAMRIFAAWFDEERDEGEERGEGMMVKVGSLMDSFMAEVAAAERGVTAARFEEMAEMVPESGRVVADGLYRAIDIFLKVHPDIKDADRLRLCKTIDCQKLSPEACTHAAQNERLPTQMAVQVLYIEQTRLRDAMNHVSNPNNFPFHSFTGHFPMRSSSGAGSGTISPRDNYASVRIENRELKLEVARMRMRLSELEKDHLSLKQEFVVKRDAASKFMRAVTMKLKKLNSIFKKELRLKKSSVSKVDLETKVHLKKRRHHSIS
ncbi:hypothetical protein Droror1_Dr00003613 [Drosera rotundifolia]